MKKITDYKLLVSPYEVELQGKVKDAISEGWQPYMALQYDGTLYVQAMVKYQDA